MRQIVFFEMNMPPFSTDTERYHVITNMRLPQIVWPSSWPERPRQREIIQSLLQHNPDDRPSASKLVQSKLLPERMEEDNMKEALRLMGKLYISVHTSSMTATNHVILIRQLIPFPPDMRHYCEHCLIKQWIPPKDFLMMLRPLPVNMRP